MPMARTVPISRVRSRMVMRSVLTTPIRMMKKRISPAMRVIRLSALSTWKIAEAVSYIEPTLTMIPLNFPRPISSVIFVYSSVVAHRFISIYSGASAAQRVRGIGQCLQVGSGKERGQGRIVGMVEVPLVDKDYIAGNLPTTLSAIAVTTQVDGAALRTVFAGPRETASVSPMRRACTAEASLPISTTPR